MLYKLLGGSFSLRYQNLTTFSRNPVKITEHTLRNFVLSKARQCKRIRKHKLYLYLE